MKNLTINKDSNSIKQGSKSKESQKEGKDLTTKPAMETKEEEEESDPESEEIQEKIDFPYNQRTKESYEKHGLKVPDDLDFQERTFLGLVNIEEDKGGPIERVITRIARVRARDYASGNKMQFREYLYWLENWYGRNWLKESLPPVADHIEGMFYEQEFRTIVDRDMKTGHLLPARKKRTGQHEEYYIPWEGKEQVDRIIGDRDKDSVIYTIKFPAGVSGGNGIRNNFSYDHFVNLKMEDAFRLNSKAGGGVFQQLTAANTMSEGGVT